MNYTPIDLCAVPPANLHAETALPCGCIEKLTVTGAEYKFTRTPCFAHANAEKMVELLDVLVDGEPCRYDHHDYCQTHCLYDRPCPHGEWRKLREGKK